MAQRSSIHPFPFPFAPGAGVAFQVGRTQSKKEKKERKEKKRKRGKKREKRAAQGALGAGVAFQVRPSLSFVQSPTYSF